MCATGAIYRVMDIKTVMCQTREFAKDEKLGLGKDAAYTAGNSVTVKTNVGNEVIKGQL